MSFPAKSVEVREQQLKVQELVIRYSDLHLYTVSGSDIVIDMEEKVKAVVAVLFIDDSAATVAPKAASTISLSNGTDQFGTAIVNSKITVASITLAANDVVIVKYIAA